MSDAADHPHGDGADIFGEEYFRQSLGPLPYDRSRPEWPLRFGRIADQILLSLRPGSVLDAGCALGFLVEALRDRGMAAWGIDISSWAMARVRPDMKRYCVRGSVTEPIEGRYDLITCTGVFEWLSEEQTRAAVRNLSSATDTVLFSSAPDSTEWLASFAEQGFSPDLAYDAGFLSPHAILFRRQPPHPPDVLRLFAECLRWRTAARKAEQRPPAPESVESLHGLQEQLLRQVQELSTELQRRNDQLTASSTDRMVQLESRLRKEFSETRELPSEMRRVASEHGELRAQLARLERRTTEIDHTVRGLSGHLDSVLHSRIWRTLTSAGGLLLRISGRK